MMVVAVNLKAYSLGSKVRSAQYCFRLYHFHPNGKFDSDCLCLLGKGNALVLAVYLAGTLVGRTWEEGRNHGKLIAN
jgi:hypothetical protein